MPSINKRIATIHIADLKLRAVIGVNEWEKRKRQNIIITAMIEYDATRAVKSDHVRDAMDYKKVKQSIIQLIKKNHYQLLEKLVAAVLDLIMRNPKVIRANVRIDKPLALRFAQSVAIEMNSRQR